MATGKGSALFQRVVVTAETDTFRIARFYVLLHGFLVTTHSLLHSKMNCGRRCYNLPPRLKSVATLPCKYECSTVELCRMPVR